MKIRVICVGKTSKKFLEEGEHEYLSRLKHYVSVERVELPDIKQQKNLSHDEIKKLEGEKIMQQIGQGEAVYLLDDKGKSYSSTQFAAFFQQQMNRSVQRINFVIGGAFGFSPEVYARANDQLSLSKMTFSHQMVRMIFFEQMYRAMTILKGEKYHHE